MAANRTHIPPIRFMAPPLERKSPTGGNRENRENLSPLSSLFSLFSPILGSALLLILNFGFPLRSENSLLPTRCPRYTRQEVEVNFHQTRKSLPMRWSRPLLLPLLVGVGIIVAGAMGQQS